MVMYILSYGIGTLIAFALLIGIALRFSCKVLAVRPASAQEVARGEPDGEREEEEN